MKHNYHLRQMLAFLTFFYCFSAAIFAQGTAPVPQELPYSQDFSSLLTTATAYPAGFQGWTASVAPGATFNTSGTLVADRALFPNSNASITSGNIHNYDRKIGFLNTGSLDLTIGFAFKTTGKSGITVEYDAMVIRNPHNGTTNTRINELVLQYRISTTDAFVTLLPTVYANGTTAQTSGTTEQSSQKIKIVLPTECDNQDVVQIRWISRQVSGGGSRPSFAVDNISIINDVTPPVNAIGYPQITNILSNGFDFLSQLDEIGKTYFVILPAGSPEPTVAQIKAGTDITNTAAIKAGLLAVDDATLVYTQNNTGLILGTTYVVYSISEDAFGNIQTVVKKLDVTTSSAAVPSLSTTKTSLEFSFVEQNFSSSVLSYELQGANLNGAVTLTSTGNFTISKDQNNGFQPILNFTAADFSSGASPTVYVKFSPNATGIFSGQITHESTGATNKIVALSGTGINPYTQDFNNPNVLTNSGWFEYSIAGNTIKWASTTTRFNSAPAAVQINGFAETGPSKDWLISPNLRLSAFDKFPLLSFHSRKFFSGPSLKLMVSVNYDGKSNPETATWIALEGDFPTNTGTFKQSQYINLEAYKTDRTYLAWVYETTAGGGANTAEWTVDDVNITNNASFIASIPDLNFGEVNPNTASPSQSFLFTAGGYGNITITAPAEYQLSLDNVTFTSSAIVLAADAIAGKTIYARFSPSSKALSISGALTVVGIELNQAIGSFKGSSFPKTETFDIVTYNLEFFGSDVKNTSNVEFGPINDALQIDNVAKVMNTLNADVYAIQEVSDDAALDILIQKISINGKTFDKVISPVWSRSFQTSDPNFPPQKLAVIYNTQTTTVKKTRVMFSQLYDELRAGTKTLPNYPDVGSSFFASGRLPHLVEIETNIGGVKKDLKIINIHARANSGSDISRFNMRKYDVELLKDSLDAQYPDANLIILGDYNDDVDVSVIAGNPSSYQKMVEDTARYNPLTLDISRAGAFSFLSSGGFLDHIIVSNELTADYVPNSTQVYDPRLDVVNYVTTTSDHAPVIARFELKADTNLSTKDFTPKKGLSVVAYPNPTSESFNVVVNSENKLDLELNIYDILGRSVGAPTKLKGSIGENTLKINSASLPAGIYIYTISNGNKVVFKDKIVRK
ncbi:Por secretion system C-terminal sorting domain-containing protein [Flavobacterium micromati]|uniref:Por secretion system C-terminal sorting domain-containing protein n=1 Tax=Flavobacterium micromati TaxID=229205 RepID=A0A1M5GPE3_9FLAO|nr:T9SS type A sorting domain-containing protein [Flavobacterium micromati]SHG05392.1 Por secretion system C-terminal sorting domain-containing protein [Flavobacterium micromati]